MSLKIELKKLKYFPSMSEETPCFNADLYENGVKVAFVKNSGTGGCNILYPVDGKNQKDIQHLKSLDVESEIFGLVEKTSFMKKNQSKGFVLFKDETFFIQKFPLSITKLKKHPNFVNWIFDKRKLIESEGYQILNTNLG